MIKDSYSNPPFYKYDWDLVMWANPLPNDLVALYELCESVRVTFTKHLRVLLENGGNLDDAPPWRQWLWDFAVVKSQFTQEEEFEEGTYLAFLDFENIGKYVHDDRMFESMTEEEMEEHFEMLNRVEDMLNEIMNNDAYAKSLLNVQKRSEEIDELNELFNSSGSGDTE
jgi:hypothetical protein